MKPAKTVLLVKSTALLFLMLGIVGLVYTGYLVYVRIVPSSLAFSDQPQVVTADQQNVPRLLIIEELSILLPIAQARVEDEIWQTNPDGISYLATTPVPGEIGNSILYGHNWPNRLGRLNHIKPGMEIIVVLSNGTKKSFKVEHTQVVTPDQTHILSTTNDRRITLFTCTGFFDSKRLVVTALLSN